MTLSVAGLHPTAGEDPQLLGSPDERCKACCARLEPALDRPSAENLPSWQWRGKSLDVLRPEIREQEFASKKPPGGWRNHHSIWWSKGL